MVPSGTGVKNPRNGSEAELRQAREAPAGGGSAKAEAQALICDEWRLHRWPQE